MNNVFDSKSTAPNPAIAILGVPFDRVTMTEALERIGRMVASRRPHYVVTANVDFLVQAQADVELHRILFDAHLVLCDGTPVVWASRLLGNPLPERVAGADIVPRLIKIAAEQNLRLFFLGSTPESMARAVANVKAQYPQLSLEGYAPPFNRLLEMDHAEIKRRIAAARPDLLFVAFGCPKQEKWIAMHYQSLGVPVAIGVGGTIDFLAGQLKRAPVWMRRTGTEWLYRLWQEPRRLFRRYATDLGVFGWFLLAQWGVMQWRRRLARRDDALRGCCGQRAELTGVDNLRRKGVERTLNDCAVQRAKGGESSRPGGFVPRRTLRDELKQRGEAAARIKASDTWQWIQLAKRLDLAAVRNDALLCDPVLADGRDCVLQMDRITFVDSSGMGWLIQLQKRIRATGRQLVLVAPGKAVKRALALMQLKEFFVCAENFDAAQKLLERLALEEREWVCTASQMQLSNRVVNWRGEITAVNAEPVWREMEKLMSANAPSPQPLVIDLSRVRFMDSSGLGLMVRARKLAQSQNVQLRFAEPQPAVLNVLRLARLEDFLLGEPA